MADAFTNYQTSRFATPSVTDIDAELASSAQRMQRAGLAIAGSIAPPPAPEELAPPSVRTAKVAYDPTQGKLFIGGYVVDKNNDTDVATMAKFAGQEAPLPEGNWQDVDPNSFTQYVQSIRDPNTLTLMAKNFGMGVDEMQQMAGYGLQWLGAESAGQYLADQGADLQRNQVYSRSFTDIGSSPENGVLDWMAATIGRLGPNIVESTISAGIGATIGGATTGPAAAAGAPIGAIAGFFGKTAVKKALLEASRKHLMGEALDAAEKKLLISAAATSSAAKAAIEKQAAGKLLTSAEEALATGARAAGDLTNVTRAAGLSRLAPGALGQYVDEALTGGAIATRDLVGRRAAQVGGAAAASYASNLFQQTGAAYGETMADGGPGDRATALAVGIPGALADTIPEFLLAGRLFSELGGDVVSAAKKRKSAMDILKGAASGRTGRIAGGVAGGAAIEGTTEGFQEVLQIAANPILDLGSPEASNRIVNAFAAGALMGGTLGGAGGAFAGNLADNKQEANLLLPVSKDDPNYAQYREDVKRQLGEAEYNKVFGPPQPYTRIMEEQAATQDMIAGIGGARRFAGTQAPLTGPDETFKVGPTPAIPNMIPGPAFGTTGAATATLPQGMQVTPTPGAMTIGAPSARPPAAPAPAPAAPPVTGTGLAMGTTMVPGQMGGMGTFEQFQAAAMQQAMAAQQAAAAPAPAPLTRMPGGSALQQAATGELPGAQPPGSMMLRRGPGSALAQTAEMQGPAAPMPGSPTVNMNRLLRGGTSGQAPATMVPPLRPTSIVGRAGDISLRRSGQATGRMVPPAAPEKVATSAPSPAGGRIDALAFLTNLIENNKTSFTKDDLRRALFPKTSLVRRTKQYTMTDTVIDRLIREELVSEGPIGTYTVDTEKVRATQPGTGTGSAAPAGKQGSEDRGPSAGDKLRQNAKATREEPAPEAEGPPAGGKPLQAEAAVPSAVTVVSTARRLKGTPGSPVDYLVTLSDGRTAIIYKDSESKDWRIDHPGARAFAPSQVGYVSDVLGATKKEAEQNVVEALDRMEAAVEEAKAANDQKLKQGKQTDLQQFLKTYADPKSFGGMRENENLADVVEYADWLGSLSKAELAKIEPVFSKRDNPFLNAGSMDVARARAKLEEAISPKAPEGAAPSKEAAEPKLTDREVWDETFDDKGVGFDKLSDEGKAAWKKLIARKGGFTVADAEQLQAQFAPKKTTEELAVEVRDKAKALIKEGLDNPNLPIPQNDLEELYFAVARVRTADDVDFSAALSNLVSYLGSGYSREAQRAARAYLDAYVEEVDVTVAKARLAAANKKAMEADKKRAEAKKAAKAMEEESKQGRYMLSQFDLVENPIDENGRPAKGVNPIRVKAIVDKFRSGLAKAPQFYVYKNQADLQRRNPALYQQAVGSRPQGDFDTARASGFAFDGKVLVFTDRIPTEKYMRLLLAHESIGHFGMRALLPASKFDALMDYVYENNPKIRLYVDSSLGVRPTGVAPMSRRGFLKGTSSVIGAAVVPKMPRIPAKLDVNTFITAYTELQNKLGNINNPDSIGKMGDLFLEILSPIKGKNASDAKQAVNKMDSILDNARRYVDDNMNRTLDSLEQQLEFGPDDDYLTYWFEENEAEAAPLLKQFSSLIEEAYQKRNVEIADHVRSTLDMVKNKLGGSAKTEARSSTSEDVDMLGARREAVEEYMAKYAEKLDSSVITRVWNAIKDVLNKLGVKFEDDIVRYLVSQARRTVREGSSAFTPSTFALNVHTITTNNGTGRFSTEPIYTAQHAMRNRLAIMDAQPANLGEVKQALKDWKVTSADLLEVMTRNVFRLRNYNALRNHGAQAFEYLKDAMRSAAQTLRNVYNERLGTMLALTGESRRAFSNAMVVSRRIADRRFALDKELRNAALLTLGDEQPDGFRELTVNEPVLKRLIELGTLSKDELDNGAEVTYEEPDANGKIVKTKVKIPGVKELVGRELTKEEYDLYVKTRKDLADLDIERLKGQYQNFLATEKVTTKGIRKVLADKNMTDDDVAFVRNIVNHAKKLFIDDIDYDERGIPAVTPETAVRMEQYFKAINTAVVKREFTDDLKAEVRKFYLPKPKKGETVAADTTNKAADAAIKRIEEFRSRRTEFTGREEQGVIYILQDRVKEIVLADAAFDKAQMAVRRSIASSHVPLWREGSWQVRVEAQINGKPVKLHPEVQNKMLFSLSEDVAGAENDAKFFNDSMKDVEYSGLVYNEENGEYKTQKFTLFARPSKAVESVASDPSIDIDNFLYTLRVLGQPLTPDKHAKAITMLTAPGSALRKALRFDDTPGYDPDKSVEAIARHVTTRSSLIARTRFQPFMRELMNLSTDSGKRWFGDAEVVMDAKDNLDKATTDKAKAYWQDRLTTELYKYVTTNPGAKGWDGSRAKFVSRPEKADLGMRDYSDAVKELEWLMDSANISESTFEGKRLAALAKMVTSVGFLGGMFTQFAQNLMSPATNVLPYLASKDSQTGFGGGFGMSVIPTYMTAFKDVVGLRGLNPFTDPIKDAEAFENIANTIKVTRDAKDTAKEAELVQQYGLSYYEALNIAREIREGKLIPAQANAMLETARGIFTGTASKLWLKFSDIYMSPFNVSEQATRRATFLTAFRLEFDRLKQAGFNEDKASEMARMFAIDTVDKTLGEYSNTNRPPVWRDGWQSLLFVYKTYPLTSLLLFKNMSRAGKIGMLTALWVLAGAAGFPLVDDMEDLIDTLSQRMGLDLGQGPSIRMAIINQLEEFFPGWSDMILRGPMNHFTGADVGAKFGLEDFIPGTGILLKGANTTEELKSIAGPVVGMGLSMSKFVYDLGRAPLSSTTSLLDATREAPISLIRAAGDVAAYMQNGAIVDRRGYVVSPEVNAMTMVSRLLGFYPAEAAKQYDFIKYANRMNYDYKEVGTAYKLAWVKAKLTGDDRQAARIVREVNEWNESNQGGPGMIRNFLKNAQRALKEARRPAGERFLKSAPVASRASYERFLEYITAE